MREFKNKILTKSKVENKHKIKQMVIFLPKHNNSIFDD